jgi:hypothetical protein
MLYWRIICFVVSSDWKVEEKGVVAISIDSSLLVALSSPLVSGTAFGGGRILLLTPASMPPWLLFSVCDLILLYW